MKMKALKSMPHVKPLKMVDYEEEGNSKVGKRNRFRMANRIEGPEELIIVTETVPPPVSVTEAVSISMVYPMTPPSPTVPDDQNDEDENDNGPSNKLSDDQILKQFRELPSWLRVKQKNLF